MRRWISFLVTLWLAVIPVAGAAQELGTVNFDFNSATLDAEARAEIARVAEQIKATPSIRPTVVIGHTDAVGSLGYNDRLGQRRAEAVARALAAQGVTVDRIGPVKSRGKRDLLINVATRERANRRVTVSLSDALAACRSWRQVSLAPDEVNEVLQRDLVQRTAEAETTVARLRGSGTNSPAFQMAGAAVEDCGTAQGFELTATRKREYAQRCLCSSARMQAALGR